MVPHMSGTTPDAQYRYDTGAQDILCRWFAGERQESANLIVENGEVSANWELHSRSLTDYRSTRPKPTVSALSSDALPAAFDSEEAE